MKFDFASTRENRWSGRGEMRAAKMFFRLLKQTEKDHQLTFLLPSLSLKFG